MSSVEMREYQRSWRAANPEKCAAYTKKYRAKNPEKTKARIDRWQERNWEKILDYHRRWRNANRQKVVAACRKWQKNNPEIQRKAAKRWKTANRERVNAYYCTRCATDIAFKIGKNLRARVSDAIRRQMAKKSDRTMKLTGCTIEFLMGHIEARFRPGMRWDNYGKEWEIDHIFPCSLYDLTDEAQQRACFHYTNLQPLTVTENRKKRNKVTLCHSD